MKEIVMRSPLKGLSSLRSKRKQKGAVAVIFGFTAVVLLSMGGLVVDMGHLYIAKAELQNAADAAALAGARRLDETAAGITNARNDAITIAALNSYNFATPLTITAANTEFSANPAGPWVSYATAFASPAGMTFVKVETGAKTLDTYLMSVAQIYTVSTFGAAVAGRFVIDVTPLGVCAIDPINRTVAMASTELMEFGFRRGISYNIPALGPLGASGVPMFLNAVDAPPTVCDPSHSNVPFTAPFICQGNSAVGAGTSVYANTGGSYGPLQKAFNSRFDFSSSFTGGAACDPVTAPPDMNVKEYDFTLSASSGGPKDWMNPDPNPNQQGITIDPATKKPLNWPLNPPAASDFGTLWSYSPAVRATGTAPNLTAGAPFTLADWPTIYNAGLSADTSGAGYPSSAAIPPFPAGTTAAPYNQGSGKYFAAPPTHPPGTRSRRLINLVIVDCSGLGGGGLSCASLPVKGIGRFFLQTSADLTGGTKKLFSEFAGLIEPAPVSEIKLYR
jgi:Flp pilus assembly protein TadG